MLKALFHNGDVSVMNMYAHKEIHKQFFERDYKPEGKTDNKNVLVR